MKSESMWMSGFIGVPLCVQLRVAHDAYVEISFSTSAMGREQGQIQSLLGPQLSLLAVWT